jgi:hypothetical protein
VSAPSDTPVRSGGQRGARGPRESRLSLRARGLRCTAAMRFAPRAPALLSLSFVLAACSSSRGDDERTFAATSAAIQVASCSGEEVAFVHSNLCVEPQGGDLTAPHWLTQQPCTCPMIGAQQWVPIPVRTTGATTSIIADNQWMCFDRPYNETADNITVQSYPCASDAPAPSQQWVMRDTLPGGGWQLEAAWFAPGYTEIVHSGQCLDVWDASTAPGTPLQMYKCKVPGDPNPGNQLVFFP